MRPFFGVIVLAVFPLGLLAADKLKELFVGKWESVTGTSKGVIVEYKADGTVASSFKDKKFSTGKYRFMGDDTVEVEGTLTIQGKEVPFKNTYKVEITKDSMTMTDQKTKFERKLKRVK